MILFRNLNLILLFSVLLLLKFTESMQLKLLEADILREEYVSQYSSYVLQAGDGKIDENCKPKEIWIALWKLLMRLMNR